MIFISHAWIDGKPDEKVLQLVAELRESGFEAKCDVMFTGDRTSINFRQMMAENIQNSDKVIIILSETYKKKADLFDGGVGIEYMYILEDIDINIKKYILVSFRDKINDIEVPDALRGREIICLSQNYEKLFYRLEDTPEYEFPEVNRHKIFVEPKKICSEKNYNTDLYKDKFLLKKYNITNRFSIEKSRTQEYANKWNENMFLNDFDKRDENAGANVKLSEVYLEEHLPHYIWCYNKKTRVDLKIGSVKKFVFLVKNGSFPVRIQI